VLTELFVDDEQPIRNALERMYLERDDVRCLFAETGQEGLEIMHEMTVTHFDPRLMELFLPTSEEVRNNG